MPASKAGVEEVVGRIRAIQRRLNASTIQNAAYLAATVGTLAASVVVATALRGGATVFGVAFWTALAAAILAALHAALRIRHGWLTIEQAAHFADRHASLDDRLATILAAKRDGPHSPLYPVLIAQVRDSAPRWDAETLTPRRVPRSLYALLAALAVLITTGFYARPPAPPPPSSTAQHGAPAADEPPQMASGGDDGGLAAMVGDGAAGPTQPHHANLAVEAPAEAGAPGGPTSQSDSGAAPRSGGGTGSDKGAPDAQEGPAQVAGLSERMQESIRDALGAGSSGPDRASAGTDSDRSGRRGDQTHSSLSQAPALPDDRLTRPEAPNQPEADQAPQAAGTGPKAPSGGSGAAANAGGLFGAQPVPKPASGNPQALAVKLGAHTALAPSQHEPQRRSQPVDTQAQGAAPANGASRALADEQLPVAALQKPDVAAEHEAIVRRIFTRDQ